MFLRSDYLLCYDNELKEIAYWQERYEMFSDNALHMRFANDIRWNLDAADNAASEVEEHQKEAAYWKSRIEQEASYAEV